MRELTSLVIGPPGCGKTTEICEMVQKAVTEGRRPMVCSLTRGAAAEAKRRGIHGAAIGTLHSHALRALDYPPMATGSALGEWNQRHPSWALSGGESDPEAPDREEGTGTGGDRLSGSYHLLRARCTDPDVWPKDVKRWAAAWKSWKAEGGLHDFSDLIERASGVPPPTVADGPPDLILVDEAQDQSRLELDLLRAWARRARGLVLVGDPWQALYVWRGAHPQMFASEVVASRRVLSQSYRVPRAVHAAATSWVKQLSDYEPIEYLPRPVDGSTGLLQASYCTAEAVVDEIEGHLAGGSSVMLAGACSYMLQPTIAELRARGVPFGHPWSTQRGEWNPLGGRKNAVSMSQRIAALLKPYRSSLTAHSLPRIDDRGPDGAAVPQNACMDSSGHTDHFRGAREMVDAADSFDFGANVAFDNPDNPLSPKGCRNATEHGSTQQTWSPTDVYRWSDVLQARGILRRGAKKDLAEFAKSGDSAISQTIVGDRDLATWFEPPAAALLKAAGRGAVSQTEVVAWWRDNLLAPRRPGSAYPLRVLESHGLDALIEKPRCHVGTIHSFKGAEADVVIVFPDLSPKGLANWRLGGVARDAVVRQFYVAMTRARESLLFCRPVGSMTSPAWEWVA